MTIPSIADIVQCSGYFVSSLLKERTMKTNINLRTALDNVIRTIDGSQPLDIIGAIAALQHIADGLKVCWKCRTTTMVEDWKDSGIHQMHCIHCKTHN